MCRIESPALRAVESKDAAERATAAEEHLLSALERYVVQIKTRRNRRNCTPTDFSFTKKQRNRLRARLRILSDAAF